MLAIHENCAQPSIKAKAVQNGTFECRFLRFDEQMHAAIFS